MHSKHCDQDATRPFDSDSNGWQSQCAKEAWSAATTLSLPEIATPLSTSSAASTRCKGMMESSKQDNSLKFIDFSIADQRGNSLPELEITDMGKSGRGSASDHKDASAAMRRLVKESLGSPGHQGAADYVRYTKHGGAMGYCAGGVEEAIRRAGLGNFHADAHALDELLAKSPHWQEVHINANQIKKLPPGYVVVMENKAGRQHCFISTGNGNESSDWHGSMSLDQLLPLVLKGKAQFRVFRPSGYLSDSIPDSVPTDRPRHHASGLSGHRDHHASSSGSHGGYGFPSSGGSDFGGSDFGGSSGDHVSEPSESPWIDPNGRDLPIGDPDDYFMTQFRSKWNPDGKLFSKDCGPASLAMFMLHANKFPPGANRKNKAQLIKAVRRAMTGSTVNEGTTEAEVRKGAAAAGIHSHMIKGMAGLNEALAKGEMVVARGNPGAAGSYGDSLSNAQYSHFDGAHFILVDGRKGDNYIISDPLSRTGPREITASQMKAYMQGLGDKGSGVALSV